MRKDGVYISASDGLCDLDADIEVMRKLYLVI